jgi:hypothetical protein
MTREQIQICEACHACGGELDEGFIEHEFGPMDPETGYRDIEFYCSPCANESPEELQVPVFIPGAREDGFMADAW